MDKMIKKANYWTVQKKHTLLKSYLTVTGEEWGALAKTDTLDQCHF